MVKRPANYLKVTRILWESLRIPDYDRISREDALTAGRIRSAFADANPGIPESAIGVKPNARGWLEEIRLALFGLYSRGQPVEQRLVFQREFGGGFTQQQRGDARVFVPGVSPGEVPE
jgi:ribonuclease T2